MNAVARPSLRKIKDETVYYAHQYDGVKHLNTMNSFLLADEMGLGKTLQVLTVAAIDFQHGFARRVLAVCPASLKWNWADEIERFTNFTYMILDGSPAKRAKQLREFAATHTDILIVNYEQVGAHLNELNALAFDIVFFDEAHYLKNPRSARTKAAHKLRAKRFGLISGSPILNRVDELWSPLHIIDPREYNSYWSFVHRFAVYGGYKNKQIIGVKNQAELKERLDGVMVRRTKSEVLDLPDKQFIRVTVDLHPEQRKPYDEVRLRDQLTVGDLEDPVKLDNALTKYLRLKQICGTTACIEGMPDYSFKLDRVVADAVELANGGNKTVLFTQFRGVQAALEKRFLKEGAKPFLLNGDVPAQERAGVVKSWAQCRDPQPIVCMYQVAGVGLNMTAARHCLRPDKLYVPKLNEQAEDRIHRIGADTTQPVQIRDYLCKGTVELRVEQILKTKSALFGSVVDMSELKRLLVRELIESEE